MIFRGNAAIRVAAFLACQVLCLGTSYSQVTEGNPLGEEISRQDHIYWSYGGQTRDGYTVDRGLAEYGSVLVFEFHRALENLGPKDRWLDIGAGEGQAILDYFGPEGWAQRDRKAQVVALSIEDRRTLRWQQTAATLESSRLRYLYNRRLRDYSVEELGRFQVITDVIGGFSYTEDLSQFVEKVLGLLELNGSFYTALQDVRSEIETRKPHYTGASYLTEITNTDGSEGRICTWLKSISCVAVTCEPRTNWVPPIEAYAVRKVCDNVKVPPLTPTHYQAGTPPERRFRVASPTPAPAPQRAEPVKVEASKKQ